MFFTFGCSEVRTKHIKFNRMHLIIHLLEQLHSDHLFGGGGKSLDMINNPDKMEAGITPNRASVFKRYNYRFKA